MTSAITFEGVFKNYRGARQRRRYLRDDLARTVGTLKHGRRSPLSVVRALENVSFEIREGDAFGIIGPNGAGKTTALKIATRISYPTRGRVRVRGRIGALIEVGTGLHPELTGRENVQLYGRILGFSGREIGKRFDEIVDFSGVADAIDQPVKQFSSGMVVRLGFAIAAHLEPDVLLVDEALAVGDAGFQYRCVEKMAELVASGRTLVFVSHDMTAIESLCTRAVLLVHGQVLGEGPTSEVVSTYLRSVDQQARGEAEAGPIAGEAFELVRVIVLDAAGREVDAVPADAPVTIRMHYRAHTRIERPHFSVGFGDGRRGAFSSASMLIDGEAPLAIEGDGHIDCVFEQLPLYPRVYEIWCGVRGQHGQGSLVHWQRIRLFEVTGEIESGKAAMSWSLRTPVRIPYRWDLGGQA